MTIISNQPSQAAEWLLKDELVAIPTETVYGLAANIFHDEAVKKIFALKQRPLFNPLIVHIAEWEQLGGLVTSIPDKAITLAKAFWPGPLTLLLPKQEKVSDLITAGKKNVAVRIPQHPLTLELLRMLSFPLAAPSANPFGSISPTTAQHVFRYFNPELKMILDGGDCRSGIESTIVGFEEDQPIVFRLGAITIEELEQCVGPVQLRQHQNEQPDAPGMLDKHYSPLTPTYLSDDPLSLLPTLEGKRIGILWFQQAIDHPFIAYAEVLSAQGDLSESAAHLYAALHRLDHQQLDAIIVEQLPNTGLGRSMNDRLQRAVKR